MASRLDSLFAPFERTRSAYPIAIFRIAFFGGLALHFFPALVHLGDSYRPGALRTNEWNDWLYLDFSHLSPATLRVASVVTMLGCTMGIVGLRPRIAAVVSGVGFYAFASFNGLQVQTLALVDAWAILLLWMICGGGSAALSVDAVLAKRDAPPREPGLLSGLVLFQILLAVFFAGVEKLLAGWPGSNEMGILLSYPRGFMVRDWVASTSLLHASAVTRALTWLTLLVELGTPFLLLHRRTRIAALVVYEGFFLGIVAMLEVPPLFYFTFAFGALLALDDAQVERVVSVLRRHEV